MREQGQPVNLAAKRAEGVGGEMIATVDEAVVLIIPHIIGVVVRVIDFRARVLLETLLELALDGFDVLPGSVN